MKLNDIIALAKQGYKQSDIKELISMAETDNNTEISSDVPASEDSNILDTPLGEPDVPTPAQIEEIELLKAELQKKEEALKAAQLSNIKQNIQPTDTKSDNDILMDMCRGFI